MTNPFKSDKDLLVALEAQKEETIDLTQQVAALTEERDTSAQSVIDLTASNEKLVTDHEAAIKTLTAESKTALDAVTAELTESKEAQTDFDGKVSAAALARMAELGVKEPVAQSEKEENEGNIYDQYCALKKSNPRAAGVFWKENEAAIKSL